MDKSELDALIAKARELADARKAKFEASVTVPRANAEGKKSRVAQWESFKSKSCNLDTLDPAILADANLVYGVIMQSPYSVGSQLGFGGQFSIANNGAFTDSYALYIPESVTRDATTHLQADGSWKSFGGKPSPRVRAMFGSKPSALSAMRDSIIAAQSVDMLAELNGTEASDDTAGVPPATGKHRIALQTALAAIPKAILLAFPDGTPSPGASFATLPVVAPEVTVEKLTAFPKVEGRRAK